MEEDIRKIVQKLLDGALLQDGIISQNLRHEDVDSIKDSKVKINKDEYVVYRVISSSNRVYGDGEGIIMQYRIDVNYYYKANKTFEKNRRSANDRAKQIQSAILSDKNFRLYVGQNDIYDLDNPFRGINMQFTYYGAAD